MGMSHVVFCVLLVMGVRTTSAFADAIADFDLKSSIQGIPNMVKGNLKRLRTGCGQMWDNGKAAGIVKKRVASGGASLSFAELQLLRRSGEDTSKLMRAGFLWLFAPELVPVMLYFYPRALPSTFESEEGRERRRGTLARMRTTAALELLSLHV